MLFNVVVLAYAIKLIKLLHDSMSLSSSVWKNGVSDWIVLTEGLIHIIVCVVVGVNRTLLCVEYACLLLDVICSTYLEDSARLCLSCMT